MPSRAWWSDRSIRTKLLAAFLLVAVVPLVLLTLLNDRATRRALTDAANQSLAVAARQTAASFDTLIENTLNLVGTEAQLPILAEHLASLPEERSAEGVLGVLRTFGRKDPVFIVSYGLLDREGRNVADTHAGNVGQSEAEASYFKGPLETGQPAVSAVEFSPGTRTAYLHFSSPVRDRSGAAVGVLRARYSARILQQWIVQAYGRAGERSFGLLLDENRLVLAYGLWSHARADEMLFKTVTPLPPTLLTSLQAQRRLPESEKGSLSADLPDLEAGLAQADAAEPYFKTRLHETGPAVYAGAVARVKEQPWTVAFFQPQEVFLEPALRNTRDTSFLGLLVAAAVAALAMAVAQKLSRPITRLTAVARRVAAGELEAQAPVASRDEAGQLAEAFNSMTTRLRGLIRSLEERIVEKERAEEALRRNEEALRREHALLRQSEERYRRLIETAEEGVWVVNTEGRTSFANHKASAMLGYTVDEMIGLPLLHFLDEREHAAAQFYLDLRRQGVAGQHDFRFRKKDGTSLWTIVSASPIYDEGGSYAGVLGMITDITERKHAEEALRESEARLTHLANHDALTGLFNRHRFEEELKIQLAQAHRYLVHGALLWCDLDQFKDINDSLGHRAGDELLIKVAASLREHVREADILARPGGDEFAVLLPFAEKEEAQEVAARLLDGIRSPVVVGGKPVRTTASIGIVLYPEHGATTEELLAHADVAMYRAKQEGRNRIMVFSGDREWQVRLSSGMERFAHIREALERDALLLYLQPIVEMRTGEIARFELLLRMIGEDGRILAPESFLGVAERFGVMREIDRWVVAHAIRLIADQRAQGRDLCLEVNLSGSAFSDLDMLPYIQRELLSAGIDPSLLVLEITETAAVTDLNQAVRFIETLKELGCQFAVDDFGVGFSSFYYLKHLPVDLLKIDGSFIENLPKDPVNQGLVKAMVEMARGLGIHTVAEYVGDAETLAWLQENGLDYAQGYYIGRPGPAAEVLDACYGPVASAVSGV
ncbi:MAG TPA: EAL domain-containing protein [Thermoanaerobaculia bacterium]|nr:EAL domain-containing protein [Thermoanaerobaculia bacterium]